MICTASTVCRTSSRKKICRQMKKNGAFVQKIWLQERPERAFTDLYDGQSGPSLPDHASPDGGTDRFPVRNPDGCGTRRGTGLKRRIPDGAVSGGCEIPGSLRCGTHHQGAGEYLRGQLQCALRKRPVCPLPVGRHGFRDRGKQGERDGGGAV